MKHYKLQILLFTIISLSCNSRQDNSQKYIDTLKANVNSMDITLARSLQVGDRIELYGGYDYDPLYLKNPPDSKRSGTVIKFINGQNESPAAVVKLDEKITGEKITGDIAILELRHVGQTWKEPTPVHIELCDFMPEDKVWKDRKQGEWVEAAASVRLIH